MWREAVMDIVGLVLGLAVFAGIIVLVDMAYRRGFDDGRRSVENFKERAEQDYPQGRPQ
jgi:DUF917 family protein